MAKKKKKRKDACDLPPEGLWISPNGKQFEVVEHLMALRERPDLFDLSGDYRHADTEELRDMAVELIKSGWTRFRYLDGTYFFEVDNAKKRMALMEDVLSGCGAHEFEDVIISQLQAPATDYQGTVADLYDRKIMRFQSNPKKNKWRLS